MLHQRLIQAVSVALLGIAHVVADPSTTLGTFSAPRYPICITDSTTHSSAKDGPCPWGKLTADRADPHDIPETGVTRRYTFNIARAELSPDGVKRQMLVVNGQFPGPAIHANWGDWIEITLVNNITGPEEGAALHWHGIRQVGTPWMDGVPSASQCPLAPGESFQYRFRADEFGSSFWHSHVGSQYSGGAYGAIIIHGPQHPHDHYDEDLGPVFLTDWYHDTYQVVTEGVVGLPAPLTQPYSDNNLINGLMPFDCTNPNITIFNRTCSDNAPYAVFKFTKGKTYRLRLMNIGSQGMQRFTIDGMKMKVITQDFIPVVPYETDVVTLGIGQRADVLVKATGRPTDSLWMRSDISPKCAVSTQGFSKAAIYYDEADTRVLPKTKATVYDDSFCGNVPLNVTTPLYAMNPPDEPATTIELNVRFGANATGNTLWWVNDVTYRPDFDNSLLFHENEGNTSYAQNPERMTYNVGSNSSVRIIVNNYSMNNRSQHPMHLHGHDYWIVAEGVGKWDGVANRNNPMRRDTHVLQPGNKSIGPAYMVLEFMTDNPGVWAFHCHLAWHVDAGLYVNILERPDEIAKLKIPDASLETCLKWNTYQKRLSQPLQPRQVREAISVH
ncbi:Cupredoxin [Chaetomium sp. MPI-SDFR-AT-0129]|nr:Cupredoxin [Chaetomium sp. MPI-SDFR-AT-0129]